MRSFLVKDKRVMNDEFTDIEEAYPSRVGIYTVYIEATSGPYRISSANWDGDSFSTTKLSDEEYIRSWKPLNNIL